MSSFVWLVLATFGMAAVAMWATMLDVKVFNNAGSRKLVYEEKKITKANAFMELLKVNAVEAGIFVVGLWGGYIIGVML
jgi:hypothetical protein